MVAKKKEWYFAGCGSRDLDEIDGREFYIQTPAELKQVLKDYGEVHINYRTDQDKDLDIWLPQDNVDPFAAARRRKR